MRQDNRVVGVRAVCVCVCVVTSQILRQMESALQYQITYEYNRTALPSNATDAETNRITAAWDIMQIEVNALSSWRLRTDARCYRSIRRTTPCAVLVSDECVRDGSKPRSVAWLLRVFVWDECFECLDARI